MSGRIRLACRNCDTDVWDGINEIPADWKEVIEVQSFDEASLPTPFDASDNDPGFVWDSPTWFLRGSPSELCPEPWGYWRHGVHRRDGQIECNDERCAIIR